MQADPKTGEILGATFTERQAFELMAGYVDARNEANRAKGFQDGIGNTIKGYLERNGGGLEDFERGNIAKLQTRVGAQELDAMTLAAKEPGLLVELASHGCLKLDPAAFKSFSGKAIFHDNSKKYLIPGRETTALVVEHKEKL